MCEDGPKFLNSFPLFDHEINTNPTITVPIVITVGHQFTRGMTKAVQCNV